MHFQNVLLLLLSLLSLNLLSGQIPVGDWEGEKNGEIVRFSVLSDSLVALDVWSGPIQTIVQRITPDSIYLGWLNPETVRVDPTGGFTILRRSPAGMTFDFAYEYSDSLLTISSGGPPTELRPVPPADPEAADTYLRVRGNRMVKIVLPTIGNKMTDAIAQEPAPVTLLHIGVPIGGIAELFGSDHRLFSSERPLAEDDLAIHIESERVKFPGQVISLSLLADAGTPSVLLQSILQRLKKVAPDVKVYLVCSTVDAQGSTGRLRFLPISAADFPAADSETLQTALKRP